MWKFYCILLCIVEKYKSPDWGATQTSSKDHVACPTPRAQTQTTQTKALLKHNRTYWEPKQTVPAEQVSRKNDLTRLCFLNHLGITPDNYTAFHNSRRVKLLSLMTVPTCGTQQKLPDNCVIELQHFHTSNIYNSTLMK